MFTLKTGLIFNFHQKLHSLKLKCTELFTFRHNNLKVNDLYLKINEMQENEIDRLNDELQEEIECLEWHQNNTEGYLIDRLERTTSKLQEYKAARKQATQYIDALMNAMKCGSPITEDMLDLAVDAHHSCKPELEKISDFD